MAKFIAPQLTSILGDDLDAIDEATLQRLIGIAESEVLEYKSEHYGKTDGKKAELAGDIACFANAAGGLLVVGMAEDDDTGEAMGLVPLPLQPHGSEEDTRYRKILASKVFPRLDVSIASVDVTGGSVLLVSVPPSVLRPHAVYRDGSLRHPIRDGRGIRHLHEWEVADAYRQRFEGARAAAGRADDVREQLLELIHEIVADGDPSDEPPVWLVMALSPDRPGHMRIDHDTVAASREWAARVRTVPAGFVYDLDPTSGFRRVDMTDMTDAARQHSRMVASLTSTGGGAGAIRLDHERFTDEPGQPVALLDVWLFMAALALGEMLAAHAVDRCGTGGTATALVNLEVIGDDAVKLAHRRFHHFLRQLGRTRRPPASTPVGRRTVALDDLWPPSSGLVSVCAALISDVTGPFGVPTPYQADREGRIRRRYVERGIIERLEQWADQHGIEVTDERAGE